MPWRPGDRGNRHSQLHQSNDDRPRKRDADTRPGNASHTPTVVCDPNGGPNVNQAGEQGNQAWPNRRGYVPKQLPQGKAHHARSHRPENNHHQTPPSPRHPPIIDQSGRYPATCRGRGPRILRGYSQGSMRIAHGGRFSLEDPRGRRALSHPRSLLLSSRPHRRGTHVLEKRGSSSTHLPSRPRLNMGQWN